jgi:hypothetical protein
MNRTFSVNRRRSGIVDVLTPRVNGVAGYRFKAASNFDAPFVTIFTSTNVGFVDTVGVDQRVIEAQATQGRVRMVFNPTTYGIDDTAHLWLTLWHVDGLGSETQMSAPTLVLPDLTQFLSRGQGHILLRGSAPAAVDVTGSLQLDMPRLMSDWRILNEDPATQAWIAFEPTGPEYVLKVPDTEPQFMSIKAASGSLWVRGDGGNPTLSIQATVANPL